MAKDQKPDDAPPLDTQADEARTAVERDNMDRLATAITRGLTDHANATGPIKQIPITKYINRAGNPQGLHESRRPQFARECYQNGKLIERFQVADADVLALDRLRAGRYLDRTVEVIVRPAEGGGLAQVEIRYPSATLEQRFAMMQYFRSFSELLTLILAEQAAPEARAS